MKSAWGGEHDPNIAVATIQFETDPPKRIHLNMAEWDYLILKPWVHNQYPELCPCADCWDMKQFLCSLREEVT